MIAITGSTGFVGSYLVDRLPYSFKKLTRQTKTFLHSEEWIIGDLENTHDIDQFVENAPILLHLACSSYPRTSDLDIQSDLQKNLLPSIHLFEQYAKKNPGGHIIFSSTGGNMYNPNQQGVIHTEDHITYPQSSYAIHKLALENYLRMICQKHGVRGTILRISNAYGTFLPKQRPQGLIGVAFAKLLANEPLQIFDSLESVRDYIHLDDITKAFACAIQHPAEIKECRLFNVSSGVGFNMLDVIQIIESTTEKKLPYTINSLANPTWSVLSYQKINQALGWNPTTPLQKGVQNMWSESSKNIFV